MELTEALKHLDQATAKSLKGAARRGFMAGIVQALGRGGQTRAMRELGWSGWSIRKGLRELESGIVCVDASSLRGRKPVESRLPHLLDDIKAIVDGQSQTDPQFRNQRLYTRLSVKEVRRQLIVQKHSADEELPKQEALRLRLKRLGYSPRMVAKTRPLKKIPQTDALFAQVSKVNAEADAQETTLRLSIDAKATVKVGEFSRNGVSRVSTQALDHDFQPEARVTPVGIFVPEHDDLHLFAVTTKVTSDCLADCLETFWEEQRHCFPEVNTRLLNLDNGPECHSRRTQFMAQMGAFVEKTGLTIRLAYYPPYHSKYNPIGRCWGILEHPWNGGLLDSIDAVLGYASSMTWRSCTVPRAVTPTPSRFTAAHWRSMKEHSAASIRRSRRF